MGGQAVTFLITQVVDPGEYDHNGQDVAFVLGAFLSAEQGSFALSGQDVIFSLNMGAAQGDYDLNGQDATFVIGTIMVADPGEYALGGQDVSFLLNMGMGAGSFQENGQAATFRIDLPAGHGSVAFNGQDVLAAIQMAMAHGSYTLTGQDADLTLIVIDPAFDVDHVLASIKQTDLGLHLAQADLAWSVEGTDLEQINLLNSDVGWKVIQMSVRLNIREG